MTATARRSAALRAATAIGAAGALLAGTAACTGSSGSTAPRPTPTASSSPVTLSGKLAVDPEVGVRFRLPVGWYQIPLGAGTHAALTRLVHDPAKVGDIEAQIRLGQFRGMHLFAIRPHGTASPDSMNLSITQAQTTTLPALRKLLEVSTGQTAADTPQFQQVTLPAGPALRVHYTLPDGDTVTQYYLISGGLAYTLTETTAASSGAATARADGAVTDAVARTLHLSATT
ncbi:MAG: hypothetical protein ACJ74O_12340 [Frankiaceae bacterium]